MIGGECYFPSHPQSGKIVSLVGRKVKERLLSIYECYRRLSICNRKSRPIYFEKLKSYYIAQNHSLVILNKPFHHLRADFTMQLPLPPILFPLRRNLAKHFGDRKPFFLFQYHR